MYQSRPSKGISLILMAVSALLGIYGIIEIPFIFVKLIWGVIAFGMCMGLTSSETFKCSNNMDTCLSGGNQGDRPTKPKDCMNVLFL
ncbi:hypothetical protein ACFFSY_23530 [Paenibacillus aurantiacus]|uniref:Uncharacterized protein n=1 Tax=Paenibacillus aurantiacus TaxID=1936118 RepID=A0ABV5KWV3_9BACL